MKAIGKRFTSWLLVISFSGGLTAGICADIYLHNREVKSMIRKIREWKDPEGFENCNP